MNKVLSVAVLNSSVLLLLSTTGVIHGWVISSRSARPALRAPVSVVMERIGTSTRSPLLLTMLRESSRPDNESLDDDDEEDNNNYDDMDDNADNDEEEGELCADEEECEIDWDAMPLDETATASSSSSSARTRLEMQWELTEAAEDCDVEIPTSCGSEPCQECAGSGNKPCRFCHGTAVLYMRQLTSPPTASACYDVAFVATSRFGMPIAAAPAMSTAEKTFEFSACPICRNGHEVCRSCQGTGWVASWTHWQDPAH